MRLTELQIDGFGHFHGETISPLGREMTVLYGPNESGKSTLLAFIRSVLFGFPSRGRNEHYPPLDGGRHGGRIALKGDDGKNFSFERFAGAHGGSCVLRTQAGERIEDPTVLRRLTGDATLDLFRNVFAFSLDEIQNEELMNNSECRRPFVQCRYGSLATTRVQEDSCQAQGGSLSAGRE